MRVAVRLCFCILGQSAPGASFGGGRRGAGWGGGGCNHAACSCGRGQRAPRAPLLRQFPPCRANLRCSGLTNFTANCSHCASVHTSTSPSRRLPPPSSASTLTQALITPPWCPRPPSKGSLLIFSPLMSFSPRLSLFPRMQQLIYCECCLLDITVG